jgi:hypothetical protein
MRQAFVLGVIGLGMALIAQDAQPQVYAPQVTTPTVARPQTPSSGLIQRQTSANMVKKPTVSPYLNLVNGGDPNLTNYQSMVRPLVNQNRVNSQQSSQLNRLEARKPSSSNSGNETLRTTGHQATWHNYSHYYPRLQ